MESSQKLGNESQVLTHFCGASNSMRLQDSDKAACCTSAQPVWKILKKSSGRKSWERKFDKNGEKLQFWARVTTGLKLPQQKLKVQEDPKVVLIRPWPPLSPKKISKSGHWGILRNFHFSIFQNNAFLRILRILYIYVFSKQNQNYGTENTVILPPAELR